MKFSALAPPLILIAFLATQSAGIAQEKTSAPELPAKPTEKPEAPKKVEVQPVARDEEIESRLIDILTATEWFDKTDVEVRDGVVFLRGVALSEEYRDWASDLAQNTQDVAAVVNRITVKQTSIWDMRPALAELKTLSAAAVQTSPLLLFGLVVVGLTWLLARAAQRLASWTLQKQITNGLLRGVVSQGAMAPILLVGIYIVLRVSGLTQLALTVLGGTGIAGLIIGIAFRDIAENFLASILISVQNPFRAGDLIEVESYRGFVQHVSTRGTLLITHDGNHVQIPNAMIYKSTVINYSANPNRRVEFVVGIGYDDSITKAQEVVKQVLDQHPHVLQDPQSRVILDELGASTVNLRAFVWLDASKHSPDAVRSSVMRMVKQSLLREGISLPDESREVIFPNNVPVQMIQDNSSKDAASAAPVESTADQRSATEDFETAEQVLSPGEGDLESDADEIQRQADQSWSPKQGANLLSEENSELATAP